jgi:type II secretory pathway pseudopilin PulG
MNDRTRIWPILAARAGSRFPASRRGISLVEILVAVGLLAAIMTPVMYTFSAGNRGMQITHEELQAHNAAIELMEQILSAPLQLIPEGNYGHAGLKDLLPLGAGSPLRLHLSEIPDIQRELRITDLKKDGKLRFKKIHVTITLLDHTGKPTSRQVSLKTLLANETN